uniref:Putative membrane protein n=1 Tax=Desulfovibrio sp. U5L TaxID=596152 RepID=I2Q202_9BACT
MQRPLFPAGRTLPALAALLALTLLLAAPEPSAAFLGLFSDTTSLTPKDNAVTVPLADVADGKAHFYAVTAEGKQVRFFVVKTPDGRVRTAFDACDVCYPEKKGYKQDGEFMVCTNCGRRFHVTRVGDVHGGCNPAPLASEVAGDSLRVALPTLAAGASFF